MGGGGGGWVDERVGGGGYMQDHVNTSGVHLGGREREEVERG